MGHRCLVIALGGLHALPGILAAAENVPAGNNLEALFAEVLREAKGVVALRRARLEIDVRHEGAGRRVEGFSRCIRVGLSRPDGRIVGERHREDLVFRARQSGQSARAAKVVRLDADDLAEFCTRVLEAAPELGQRNLGGVNAFGGLLKVALSGAAALKALLHVPQDGPVRPDVFLGEGDEAGITYDVEVGLGCIECDQFGAFVRAGRRCVNARRLPPHFVDRRKAIE